jgi:hypothetical protein
MLLTTIPGLAMEGKSALLFSLPASGVGAHWQTLCVEVNRITGCSTQSVCSGVPPPERRHQQDRSSQNLGRFSKLSSVSLLAGAL